MDGQLDTIKQNFRNHISDSIGSRTQTIEQPSPEPAPQPVAEEAPQWETPHHSERATHIPQEPMDGTDPNYMPPAEETGEELVVQDELHEQAEEEVDELAGLPEELRQKFTQLQSENEELKTRVEAVSHQDTEYRRKVNNLINNATQLKTNLDAAKQQQDMAMQQAMEPLQRFQNINMAQLTLEQQQQVNAEYQQAQMQAYTRKQQIEQQQQQIEQQRQHALEAEAEASLGVLQAVIPGWGEEKYRAAMKVATEMYDYTPEQVEKEVDWKVMKMWHDLAEFNRLKEGGAEVMRQVGVQKKPPAPGRGTPVVPQRNVKGQYMRAKENLYKNAGNRDAMAAYFRARNDLEKAGKHY